MKPSVVMLRATMVDPEPRLEKTARFLVDQEWAVSVVAWDRTTDLPSHETREGFAIYRIPIRANFGSGFSTLFPLLKWQFKLLVWLFVNRRDYHVIHSADFDTIVPAYIMSVLFKKRLVYDIYDIYVDSRLVPQILKGLIHGAEIWFINRSDVVLLADESRVDQIRSAKPKRLEYIYNTPDIKHFDLPIQSYVHHGLHIAYVGVLSSSRGLLELIDVVSRHLDWQFDLAGFGIDEPLLLAKIKHAENIIFHGRVSYDDSINIYAKSDVIVATYDPKIKNHQFSSPNKVFEAMALGKPIIVAKDTGVDKMVSQMGIGAAVQYGDILSLEGALLNFSARSPSARLDFSYHSRWVYETYFSWSTMQIRLKSIYNDLL
jgi:glycosyltransferase involved in cell wall biosynthesis